MTTRLNRFIQRMRELGGEKLTALMGLIFEIDGLRESFGRQNGSKAPGVDGIRKKDDFEGLDGRLAALSARIRRNAYKPLPARRSYIEKENGSKRPLGIPSFEDRLVQDRLSAVLQAIWEPEFKEFSFGFRPGRGAHDALYWLAQVIRRRQTQWVVEADIRGFFDHLGHSHLMEFLRRRIADPNLLRLIGRFLKAGVMEDGALEAGREGAPQGALVSPVLANIYLHYVTFGRKQGSFYVGRRTIGKRLRKKLRAFGDELDKRSTEGGTAMIEYADRHLRGHMQYDGVSGNFRSVRVYIYLCAKRLYRTLIRRSQRRRLTWASFWARIAPRLPTARIVHNFFVPPAVWLTRTGSRMV